MSCPCATIRSTGRAPGHGSSVREPYRGEPIGVVPGEGPHVRRSPAGQECVPPTVQLVPPGRLLVVDVTVCSQCENTHVRYRDLGRVRHPANLGPRSSSHQPKGMVRLYRVPAFPCVPEATLNTVVVPAWVHDAP